MNDDNELSLQETFRQDEQRENTEGTQKVKPCPAVFYDNFQKRNMWNSLIPNRICVLHLAVNCLIFLTKSLLENLLSYCL